MMMPLCARSPKRLKGSDAADNAHVLVYTHPSTHTHTHTQAQTDTQHPQHQAHILTRVRTGGRVERFNQRVKT